MKKALISLLFLVSFAGFSATFTTKAGGNGNFDDASNWVGGSVPSRNVGNNTIIINHPLTTFGNLNINSSSSNVQVNSTLQVGGVNVSQGGQISGSGTLTATITFDVTNGNPVISANLSVRRVRVTGGNGTTFNGTVTTTNNINLTIQNSGVTFNDDVTVGGDLLGGVKGGNDVRFNGDLSVGDDVILTERGDYFFAQTVTIADRLTASGNDGTLNFQAGSNTTITNSMTINNNYSYNVAGTVAVGGNLSNNSQRASSISGSLTVGGDFTMTSNTSSSDVSITGNLAVGGDIEITGNGLLETETGSTISATNITINSNASDAGLLNDGAISITGSLSLTGNARLDCDGTDPTGTVQTPNTSDCSLCTSEGSLATNCNVVLPISLSYFNAQIKNGMFAFTWQTVLEENNDYFNLEYSNDGTNFQSFATVDGAGNSFETLDYEYYESNIDVASDVVYFRLKQTDFDGQFSYSYVVPVSMSGASLASLFYLVPNPVQNEGELRLLQFDPERIYDAEVLNVLTMNSERNFVVENGKASIDFSTLESGVYFIRIDGFLDAVKVIVE